MDPQTSVSSFECLLEWLFPQVTDSPNDSFILNVSTSDCLPKLFPLIWRSNPISVSSNGCLLESKCVLKWLSHQNKVISCDCFPQVTGLRVTFSSSDRLKSDFLFKWLAQELLSPQNISSSLDCLLNSESTHATISSRDFLLKWLSPQIISSSSDCLLKFLSPQVTDFGMTFSSIDFIRLCSQICVSS